MTKDSTKKTDREELITLRISLARIAQVLNLSMTGRFNADSPYEVLRTAAEDCERGWNALACTIVDEIELLNSKINRLRAELYERKRPVLRQLTRCPTPSTCPTTTTGATDSTPTASPAAKPG